MNKQQRKQFLIDNWKLRTLNFKCSRAGVVRIFNQRNEKTNYYAGGGGYDKYGTCLAELIEDNFMNELKKLDSTKFYGLTHSNIKTRKEQKKASKNTRTYLQGACGFDCMRRILEKIGFKLNYVCSGSDNTIYTLNY